jgi:hypothetical protein
MNEATALSFVQLLTTSNSVPLIVVRRTVTMLMRQMISAQDSPASPAIRQILSAVHQRHPITLQKVGAALIQEGDDMKEQVEPLLISLSMVRALPVVLSSSTVGLTFDVRHFQIRVREATGK